MNATAAGLPRLFRCFWLLLAAAVLAGCASTRTVDSSVSTFSTLPGLPSPPTYRLERLPSQQAQAVQFAPIEALAQQSLARVGLQRDDTNARLVLQIGANAATTWPASWPYYGPAYPGFGWGLGWGRGGWGWGMGTGWMMDRPPTLYRREVSLVMRDAATQKILYETSATYEDVWVDDPAIFGILFDAALTGFPNPPAGPRQVRTTIAPAGQGYAPAPSPAAAAPAVPAVPGTVVKP